MAKQTRLLTASDAAAAARILINGGIVALPTETVYGLAANALDAEAVAAVFAAKGRPADNPLIVHVARPGGIDALTRGVPDAARRLIDAFWPGPLTLVLNAAPAVPEAVTAGLSTVAVRCPAHPVMRAVIEACGFPVAAPSANLSGRPSPTTAAHVMQDLDGRIDAVIDGGECDVGIESTVLDMSSEKPCVLRPGAVTRGMIESVLGQNTAAAPRGGTPKSPGLKYRHYAPKAPMRILDCPEDACEGAVVLCCDEERGLFASFRTLPLGPKSDPAAMMRRLYAALREADALDPPLIAATCPDGDGFAALRDRLYRASAADN
ncbi:MAG: L-threonylcarbamoyladenylate synthase [Oscillospiraceae bacterium]|nr:L-threonylcarbamoyladenylate synthase [Oscillospiraceae bacterium]